MKIWAFLLIIIVNASGFAQTIEEKANTAKNATFMSDKERKVVFYHNIARLDGVYFIENYLDPFMEKTTDYSKNADYNSLVRELKKVKNLPVLNPTEDLTNMAKEHAVTSGKTGHVGHRGYNIRSDKYCKDYSYYSENCDYGVDDPLEVVIDLLIDEGVPGKGHRENILNPDVNSIGVGYAPHKTYEVNVVCEFGKK
ncbi:MAG: CAP domain-containing protein [Crocinitomicaceae bacterium]